MRKRFFKNIDWSILICTIILLIIGLFAIYSANAQSSNEEEFNKQIIWIIVSIPFFIACMLVDYHTLAKIATILYGIILILLIAVLFTTPISGATSWFVIGNISIQPSEFAKVIVILFLALVMSKMKQKGGKRELNKITRILLLFIILGVPLVLIIKQPDYGTAMAFLVAFILMLFVARNI